MKRLRLLVTVCIIVAAISGVMLIPLPTRVFCSVEVHPRGATTVYVEVPGYLEEVRVKPGMQVTKGELIAELSNIEQEIQLTQQQGEVDWYETQLDGMQAIGLRDQQASAAFAGVQEALESAHTTLVQLELDAERLQILAPVSGTVLAPPHVSPRPETDGHLPTWSGSPLDPENHGVLLQSNTKLCVIGDPKKLEAHLVIDQNDINLVYEGDEVDIMLKQTAGFVYTSKIETTWDENIRETPKRLSGTRGGPIPSQTDQTGVDRPLKPYYGATVPLPEHEILRVGLIGQARIKTAPQTLGWRLYRYLTRTFNFDL